MELQLNPSKPTEQSNSLEDNSIKLRKSSENKKSGENRRRRICVQDVSDSESEIDEKVIFDILDLYIINSCFKMGQKNIVSITAWILKI